MTFSSLIPDPISDQIILAYVQITFRSESVVMQLPIPSEFPSTVISPKILAISSVPSLLGIFAPDPNVVV
jgi:hypothetical protein